jgi:hypothetical protein
LRASARDFLNSRYILFVSFYMKKFVVLIFAVAGLAFLSEPTARAGVHFAFGFPIPVPAFYGPGYYDPYPYYDYYPGYAYYGGYYGPYWRHRYYYGYYGRGYYGHGYYGHRYYGRGYYGHGNWRH